MIKLVFGNIGSGKTASVVRDIVLDKTKRVVFSNIEIKGIKNNVVIHADMIIKKELLGHKSDGTPNYKLTLNEQFWKDAVEKYKSISVVLDESHTLFNARSSQTKVARVMNDFLALLRRVLGATDSGTGELVLISQLSRRVDVIAREMATSVQWTKCYFKKVCMKCGHTIQETNETPEQKFECVKCKSTRLKKCNHVIEVWKFTNLEMFDAWYYGKQKTYFKHFLITDIEATAFPYYNTLQWNYLISEMLQ